MNHWNTITQKEHRQSFCHFAVITKTNLSCFIMYFLENAIMWKCILKSACQKFWFTCKIVLYDFPLRSWTMIWSRWLRRRKRKRWMILKRRTWWTTYLNKGKNCECQNSFSLMNKNRCDGWSLDLFNVCSFHASIACVKFSFNFCLTEVSEKSMQ